VGLQPRRLGIGELAVEPLEHAVTDRVTWGRGDGTR
jgi:hypothetical protein